MERKVSGRRILGLLEKFLKQGVMESMNGWQPTARGWGNYCRGGVRNMPVRLDQWIWIRLRSILLKRDKRKGRGRGRDHNRYPNAWFAERGLVFLIAITHDSAASPAQ